MIFNTFIFGAMFGWALFSFRAISNGTIGVLTSGFGTPAATALPEFATRAILTVVLFLAYELCYWLHHYLCHRVPFLWEFHKVHHSANVLTPITVFRVHPVDTWLFANMMAVAVGTANGVANYAVGATVYQYVLTDTNLILVVFIHLYVHFQHSHLWIAFRGLAGRVLSARRTTRCITPPTRSTSTRTSEAASRYGTGCSARFMFPPRRRSD